MGRANLHSWDSQARRLLPWTRGTANRDFWIEDTDLEGCRHDSRNPHGSGSLLVFMEQPEGCGELQAEWFGRDQCDVGGTAI